MDSRNSINVNNTFTNGRDGDGGLNAYEKFQKYWWLVRRKLWLVVIFAIIGGLYKYNEVLRVQELFSATSTLVLDGAPTNRAVALLGVPGARYTFANELFILRSDHLSRMVAQNLLTSFENSDKSDTLSILKGRSGTIASIDVIGNRARRAVRFTSGGQNDNIIYIRATLPDPHEAARLSNAYANTYQTNNVEESVRQIRNTSEYLSQRIQETNDSLRAVNQRILDFHRKHGYSQYDVSTSATLRQISSLQEELDRARLEMISNQEEIRAIDSTMVASRSIETDLLLDATDNLLNFYSSQISDLILERERIRSELTAGTTAETNPRIRIIEQRLAEYRQRYRDLLDQKLDSPSLLASVDGSLGRYWIEMNTRKQELQNRNRSIPRKIEAIHQQIREYELSLEDIPMRELELERLTRLRDRYNNSIFTFYSRQQEMELARASEGGYVSILDYAQPNINPINKQTTTGIFQGAMYGIAIAVLLIIGVDRIDDRIKSDEDIRDLPIGVTAAIPSIRPIIAKEFDNKNFMEYKDAYISTSLVTMLKPLSGISEMYRRLRTNFLFSIPDKKNKSIVITSANPQEGKSLSTSNLGVVLAQSGKRVLIIDADLRRPNIDVFFGLNGSPGLTDYIVGNADYEDIFYASVAENLMIVPSGTQVPNPSEIVGSDMFRDFYERTMSEFDFVLIDSPPLNSVVDAATISELADLCLIVVNAGKTKKKELGYALSMMHFNQQKIMGILLNNIDEKSFITDYNYYNSYNYYGNRVTDYKTNKRKEPTLWDKLNA